MNKQELALVETLKSMGYTEERAVAEITAKKEEFQKAMPDSNYYVKRAKEADEKGFAYFQIQCDVCGYLDTSMCWGSSFDFCDGHSGTGGGTGREYVLDAEQNVMVSNFKARELTGREPEMAEWVRFTRFPEL